MAASSRHSPGQECSEFTRLLQSLSNRLTQENLSDIKLYLCTEKMLRNDTIDEIKFSSDAFFAMGKARLITENDCRTLSVMLSVVGRVDLCKETEIYQAARDKFKRFDQTDDGAAAAKAHSPSMTATCMETEEETSSSQESSISMTDEEKLKQMSEYESQDLFDDDN